MSLPTPYAAARVAAFLAEHLSWSAFWDKREGVWRVSEDDPESELYAVSRDADTVILYMTANTSTASVGGCCAGSSQASRARHAQPMQ
jgi:hypothetical protein